MSKHKSIGVLLTGSIALFLGAILFAGLLIPSLALAQPTTLLETPELPDEPQELRTRTPPTITVPDDIVVEAGSDQGAQLIYRVTAQDNVDGSATLDENNILSQDNVGGNIAISCNYPSGTPLPIRNDTVYCSATDAAGNQATAHFTAVVRGPTLLDTPELPEPRELNTQDQNAIDQETQTLQAEEEDTAPTPIPIPSPSAPPAEEGGEEEPTPSPSPAGAAGINASLSANPTTYNGPCTATIITIIQFSGTISDTIGNREVTYRFLYSDGHISRPFVIHFDQPGSESISTQWSVNGPLSPGSSDQRWVAIEILQPVQLQSNRAEFELTCPLLDTPELPEPRELNTQDQNAIDQQALQTLQAEDDTAATGTTGMAPGGTGDTTPPTVDVPDDMVLQTNGTRALLEYRVTAQDNVDGSATLDEYGGYQHDTVGDIMLIDCGVYWSPKFLSLGNYSITCTATDSSGNEGNATFTVAIVNPNCPAGSAPGTACTTDAIAPTLTVPSDMVLQTNGTTALLKYPVTAQDNVDGTATLEDTGILIQDNVGGDIQIICTPKSDIILPIGEHPVQCSAIDAAGIESPQATFKVSIIKNPDPIGPTPTPAAGGITVSANPTTHNGPCPANIQVSGTITDNVGNRDVTYRFIFPATGGSTGEQVIHFNQPGSQMVTLTESDFNGRPIQGSVAIEILQPVQLQSNQAQFQITCTPAAGAAAGGPDTTKPTLTKSGGGEINYDVDNTALVDYQVTAQDNVDGSATLDVNNMLSQDNVGGSITISCSPASPSKLPIGDHTVECTATDAAGNPGTLSFTISIPRPTTPVGPTLQAAEDEDTTAGAAADGEEEEDTTAPPATTDDDDDDDAAAGGGGGTGDTDDSTTGGAGDTSDDDVDSSAGGTDGTDDNEPQ